MDKSRVALGRWGESLVARYYESAGYQILDRNWQVRGGELDLVMRRGGQIVFCEVKTRSSTYWGDGFEAVDYRKQRFLRRTAVSWLDSHEFHGDIRFDVASVVGAKIDVIEGAF